MIIPRSISVTVVHRGQPAANVLVWVNVLTLGSAYYRTHVGLTNAEGVARLTGEQLQAMFKEDRSTFLMDYRVPLEDCDDEIVLGIEGGAAFVEHRQAALAASLVTPAARRNWAAATNATLKTMTTRRRLPRTVSEDVVVRFAVDAT